MNSPVGVPLSLVLIVSALALWALLDHVLIPLLRAVMRRRFNRAIEDLNARLKLRIQASCQYRRLRNSAALKRAHYRYTTPPEDTRAHAVLIRSDETLCRCRLFRPAAD
jgi:hypothetical protein